MSLETSQLSASMDRLIGKADALAALSEATGMDDKQLLAQMPGLKGSGTVNLTANHSFGETGGSIPSADQVRIQISGNEEYLLTLGATPTIVPYGKEPEGFDNH